jgi:hypothetical protein
MGGSDCDSVSRGVLVRGRGRACRCGGGCGGCKVVSLLSQSSCSDEGMRFPEKSSGLMYLTILSHTCFSCPSLVQE